MRNASLLVIICFIGALKTQVLARQTPTPSSSWFGRSALPTSRVKDSGLPNDGNEPTESSDEPRRRRKRKAKKTRRRHHHHRAVEEPLTEQPVIRKDSPDEEELDIRHGTVASVLEETKAEGEKNPDSVLLDMAPRVTSHKKRQRRVKKVRKRRHHSSSPEEKASGPMVAPNTDEPDSSTLVSEESHATQVKEPHEALLDTTIKQTPRKKRRRVKVRKRRHHSAPHQEGEANGSMALDAQESESKGTDTCEKTAVAESTIEESGEDVHSVGQDAIESHEIAIRYPEAETGGDAYLQVQSKPLEVNETESQKVATAEPIELETVEEQEEDAGSLDIMERPELEAKQAIASTEATGPSLESKLIEQKEVEPGQASGLETLEHREEDTGPTMEVVESETREHPDQDSGPDVEEIPEEVAVEDAGPEKFTLDSADALSPGQRLLQDESEEIKSEMPDRQVLEPATQTTAPIARESEFDDSKPVTQSESVDAVVEDSAVGPESGAAAQAEQEPMTDTVVSDHLESATLDVQENLTATDDEVQLDSEVLHDSSDLSEKDSTQVSLKGPETAETTADESEPCEKSVKTSSVLIEENETEQVEEPSGSLKTAVEALLEELEANDLNTSTCETTAVDASPPEIIRVEHKFDALDVAHDDDSDLTVSIVTWNLAEASPSEEDAMFIRRFRKTPAVGDRKDAGSDLVLISGQECENTKPRRAEGHRSRELRRLMIKMLGKNYVPLAIHSLGGVQLGLFCRRAILSDVEFVSVADVACGIGNVFHNKGAIGAFVQMKAREPKRDTTDDGLKRKRAKSLRMLFVNAHLAAHVKNIEARNMDYWRIASELEAQAPARFLPPKPDAADEKQEEAGKGSGSYLMDSVDRVFFCGDLNYRVDLPREEAEFTVQEMRQALRNAKQESTTSEVHQLRSDLLRHDQLLHTIAEGAAFPGFVEGDIRFPPTFKFDKSTNDYDTSHKQRIPAWTDRILFRPFGVRVLEYTSVQDATHSDHRPVYATFRVKMVGREEQPKAKKRRRKRDKGTDDASKQEHQ